MGRGEKLEKLLTRRRDDRVENLEAEAAPEKLLRRSRGRETMSQSGGRERCTGALSLFGRCWPLHRDFHLFPTSSTQSTAGESLTCRRRVTIPSGLMILSMGRGLSEHTWNCHVFVICGNRVIVKYLKLVTASEVLRRGYQTLESKARPIFRSILPYAFP